jgi:alpha-L-fucosidase
MRSCLPIRVCLGLLLVASARAADTPPAASAVPVETPTQKAERMKWWADARFGLFLHWGPVSLMDTEIGLSRGKEVPIEVYDQLYKKFNPVKFDAKQIVSLAKEVGVRYIVLVTKHHDGFSMYATKLSNYNIMHTPFGRDVARELAAECRRQGVRFCTYYSNIDWYHPDYLPRGAGDKRPPQDANFDRYFAFMKGQVQELVENYHPAVLWFDGEWENHWTAERGREIYAMLRRLDPTIIINNRLGKGRTAEYGMSPPETTVGDFHTPEQVVGPTLDDRSTYWECCVTLCEQWAWKPNDRMKSLKECIDLLVANAGRDGNTLLNVGPMANGQIEPRQVERLREIGQWMKQFGDSIYGTRGGPLKPGPWGVTTCKDNRIFVHVLKWPDDGPLKLPGVEKKAIASRLLGGGDVEVKQSDASVTIAVPLSSRQPLDTVIELKLN